MSWQYIIKHRPKDKEGNYITVVQEHANTIREWLENNKEHKNHSAVQYIFDLWEEEDFAQGELYDSLRALARNAGYTLYR
tara:strand:- start:28 stop:267 length:240 start_codon:yes stop_codon:yes gene_type:complete